MLTKKKYNNTDKGKKNKCDAKKHGEKGNIRNQQDIYNEKLTKPHQNAT